MPRGFLSVLCMPLLFWQSSLAYAQDVRIGSSLPDLSHPFFSQLQSQIQFGAESLGGVTVQSESASRDAAAQISQIENFVAAGVDAILVAPVDSAAVASAIEQSIDAGVPVVTIDVPVNVEGILAHVGIDFARGGQAQANFVRGLFPDGASILNLASGFGAEPERNAGFHAVVDPLASEYPIVSETSAGFDRASGHDEAERVLAALSEPPDVIVAGTDEIALGALEAVNARGLQDETKVIGFGAAPDGLAAVADGGLAATVEFYPGQLGHIAVETAVAFVRNGQTPEERTILVRPNLITMDNMQLVYTDSAGDNGCTKCDSKQVCCKGTCANSCIVPSDAN